MLVIGAKVVIYIEVVTYVLNTKKDHPVFGMAFFNPTIYEKFTSFCSSDQLMGARQIAFIFEST